MRSKYRLYELTPDEFEELCSKICIKILGEGFINFASGKDGGRDGFFQGKANSFPSENQPYSGKFVIQAKHIKNPAALCDERFKKDILQTEGSKMKKLVENKEINHYFILTNRKLTGGQELSIRNSIKKEVPKIKSISIWGIERISTYLDMNRDLHKEFGFDKPRSPLNIRPEDLIAVVKKFRQQITKTTTPNTKVPDFIYTPTDKKNEINNLSEGYYSYIKEESEKYFHRIEDFLKNPRNKKYKDLYNTTAYDFKGDIISKKDNYNNFDEILEEVFSISYNHLKGKINKHILKVFIHFMYFNCDIGQKEN